MCRGRSFGLAGPRDVRSLSNRHCRKLLGLLDLMLDLLDPRDP